MEIPEGPVVTGAGEPSITVSSINKLKELSKETLEIRKGDPWVRALPMEQLVAHQFETLATSSKLPPFKLLIVGRNILQYVQEAKTVPLAVLENMSVEDVLDSKKLERHQNLAEIPNLMRIFSNLFRRILATKFDPEDEKDQKSFYDSVWSCHVQGKIDFSESAVIHLLLEKFPKYLEEELVEAIKKWKPGTLVPLCMKHSHTFQILFNLLCQIFDFCNHHSRIMDFTVEFLKLVEVIVLEKPFDRPCQGEDLEQSWKRYEKLVEMYPIPFHPTLYFIAQVKLNSLFDTRVSFENSIIQDEMLELVNDLFAAHSEEKSLITFFIATNETTIRVINTTNAVGVITMSRYPFLWKILHKTD